MVLKASEIYNMEERRALGIQENPETKSDKPASIYIFSDYRDILLNVRNN